MFLFYWQPQGACFELLNKYLFLEYEDISGTIILDSKAVHFVFSLNLKELFSYMMIEVESNSSSL